MYQSSNAQRQVCLLFASLASDDVRCRSLLNECSSRSAGDIADGEEIRPAGLVCKAQMSRTVAGFVYLLYPSHPTTSSCQTLLGERRSRPAGDATRERTSTCGVSTSDDNIMLQRARAIQPMRNRSWAPRRRVAAASKRYGGLTQQEGGGFPMKSLITHEIIF